jgi:hypothetical protein
MNLTSNQGSNMSVCQYDVTGIIWAKENSNLPSYALVRVRNYLTNLGYEDFEPEGTFDHLDALDDEDEEDEENGEMDAPDANSDTGGNPDDDEEDELDPVEEFWMSYEPSDEAMKAFDAEWDAEIIRLLTTKFGVKPLGYASHRPCPARQTVTIEIG